VRRLYPGTATDSVGTGLFTGTDVLRWRALLLVRALLGLPCAGAGTRGLLDPLAEGPGEAVSAVPASMRKASRFFTPAIHAGGLPRPVHVFPVFGSRYFATPIAVLVFLRGVPFLAFRGKAVSAVPPSMRKASRFFAPAIHAPSGPRLPCLWIAVLRDAKRHARLLAERPLLGIQRLGRTAAKSKIRSR
jgi:hypothetical protein